MKVYRLKIIAGAPRTEMRGQMADGTLKVAVAAVPEKGKANAALLRFLAAEFGVEQKRLEIISGASSREKLVRVN